ncbi:MAG: GntG family PLP-dependent aldolase [Myxococcales bacterium]|nr:beta-eliminating lyase-related protein [Polyangiaceae bacterium]MDW8248022.1 GntG family PLP-dependent aldolase [Myxococcales bacterium]
MPAIDLRSDTVTRPTPAMREAMARAEVGDDVYREDPTVNALEEQVAALCGKEAALFVPSGTLSNQIALILHTRRGDEVIIGEGAHCAWYESGAGAALAGVQFAVAGRGGLFSAAEMKAACKPEAYYYPRTSLVVLENTHNRSGGRCWPPALVDEVTRAARAAGLALHLDGARLWNASEAQNRTPAELCTPFDTVSVCFSKGLGAPVGSALLGPLPLIREALRLRKMLGGGMRQVGMLAAAAIYALNHHRTRLGEDHRNARAFAEIVAQAPGVVLDPLGVETNIVNVQVPTLDAQQVVLEALKSGVLLNATSPHTLRAVFHLDVSAEQAREAATRLASAIAQLEGGA